MTSLLAKGGLQRVPVTPEEMKSIEPTLAGHYYGGFYTASDSTGDIHKFTGGLAEAAARRGVAIVYGSHVAALDIRGKGVTIETHGAGSGQRRSFDRVVICVGNGSRALPRSVGDRVNIYPVKGYSITVNLSDQASRDGAPTISLLDDETKLVTSRLGADRFRVAGTAEFNGYNRNIRADRIKPLVDCVETCFPGVNTRSVVPWAGLRPMMPDMLPRVGRGNSDKVFYNTGHGRLG